MAKPAFLLQVLLYQVVTLQVYYVSRGKVKPANKTYSSVRNDYQLHLDSG